MHDLLHFTPIYHSALILNADIISSKLIKLQKFFYFVSNI